MPFQHYCTTVSLADFEVIAAEALMAAASPNIVALGDKATAQDVLGERAGLAETQQLYPRPQCF